MNGSEQEGQQQTTSDTPDPWRPADAQPSSPVSATSGTTGNATNGTVSGSTGLSSTVKKRKKDGLKPIITSENPSSG